MRKRSDTSHIKQLQDENKRLKEQLLLCKGWIAREIAEKAYFINKRKAQNQTKSQVGIESYEDLAQMVENYLGQLVFVDGANTMIPHLIDAESNFFYFMKKNEFDGFVVTNGYQKALEVLIEKIIIDGYRKSAKRITSNLRVNNLLEKTLHKTVMNGYSLSVGKFFDAVKTVRSSKLEGKYEKAFAKYLAQSGRIGEYVLSDDFFALWEEVLETQVFGSRRHSGSVTKAEVQKLRSSITGNYESHDSMIYSFLQAAQSVDAKI